MTFLTCTRAKAWRTVEDLDPFRDPALAREAAGVQDVTGGRQETRVMAVWRLLKEQIQILLRDS